MSTEGDNKPIYIEISAGELLDRMIISGLKLEALKRNGKDFKDALRDQELFSKKWDSLPNLAGESFWKLIPLISELDLVLKAGWDLENEIRKKIYAKEFNKSPSEAKSYIEISIKEHQNNSKRNEIKNKISSFFSTKNKEIKIFETGLSKE